MADFTWEVLCVITDEVQDSGTETTFALAKIESAAALVTAKDAASGTYNLRSTVLDDVSEVVHKAEHRYTA